MKKYYPAIKKSSPVQSIPETSPVHSGVQSRFSNWPELHNEQEYYWPTNIKGGAHVVSNITSDIILSDLVKNSIQRKMNRRGEKRV